jgi:CRP/FNR family cyclic AMP-dependent transcriptional regulator
MEGLERFVREHPIFAELDEDLAERVGGCARNVRFPAGEYLLRHGQRATQIYLIRRGRVALETAVPGRSPLIFETVQEGEVVGASWLVPPHRCCYDARALELTRALALDAECLRQKSEEDHDLGYELMKRFTPVLVRRLEAARFQILDVYGQ